MKYYYNYPWNILYYVKDDEVWSCYAPPCPEYGLYMELDQISYYELEDDPLCVEIGTKRVILLGVPLSPKEYTSGLYHIKNKK